MAEYFYSKLDSSCSNSFFLKSVRDFANTKKKQIYVLSAPLTDNRYSYQFEHGYIILIPGKKIVFVNAGGNEEDFLNFIEDVKEDISHVADKYSFSSILGRKRTWDKDIFYSVTVDDNITFNSLYDSINVENENKRRIEIFISLFIGSINDAKKVSIDTPDNILDIVKKKILLFDTDQTRFIYDDIAIGKKVVRIQGLSGTGKTELLLHKLKDLYLSDCSSVICMTCHNRVLANDLRDRIKSFFNNMLVSQQIDWEERMFCVNAWGKSHDEKSGVLRYICHVYDIPFLSLREAGNFKNACSITLNRLKQIKQKTKDEFKYAFTYMFIDESQDFDESFFELCENVTEKRLYIAGDIFQSIFEDYSSSTIQPDLLLSRCYRTDPKTFMFAQALGMGLFEEKKIWWLDKDNLKRCGYTVVEDCDTKKYELTREPIRRFEDIEDYECLDISCTTYIEKKIVEILEDLKSNFPNIQPSDIGIILLDDDDYIYNLSTRLSNLIFNVFDWESNIAHETKKIDKDSVFISNKNNVKGLEFSFVICYTKSIGQKYSYRNSLYTMLTRSFLRSYLVVEEIPNNGLSADIINGANYIKKNNKMIIDVPSQEVIDKIKQEFLVANQPMSLRDRVESILKDWGYSLEKSNTLIKMIEIGGVNHLGLSDDELKDFILNIIRFSK